MNTSYNVKPIGLSSGFKGGMAFVFFLLMWAAVVACAAVENPSEGWRPVKPVRLLLPFAPGGGSDALARVITPKLQEYLGQPWVIDNRGGAGGNIAADIVVHANPDGHTVFMGFSTVITVNPHLYKLAFDPIKDLLPVTMLNSGQYMLVLHPSVKADNFTEFVALSKSKTGGLSYSSAGIGTPLHLAAELFKARTGANLVHVPYKGGGPASLAVLAGEVQLLFGSLPSVLPQVKTGRLRALAVTGLKRAQLAPDIPTVAEMGYKDFEVGSWYGFFLPRQTNEKIVRTLTQQALRIIDQAESKEAIMKLGLEVTPLSGSAFNQHIIKESQTWAKVIQSAGIRSE